MMIRTQTMLFLFRQAPYGSSVVSGGMDLMLTAAAFDQDINLAFSDDGIYLLLKEQNSNDIGLKNLSKILPSLDMYEVRKVFVEESALKARGLKVSDLLIPVELLNSQSLSDLAEQADQVFNF